MTAFVTGGSRGIGREIVLKFVREGWDCAFTYRGNRDAAEQTLADAREAAGRSSPKNSPISYMDACTAASPPVCSYNRIKNFCSVSLISSMSFIAISFLQVERYTVYSLTGCDVCKRLLDLRISKAKPVTQQPVGNGALAAQKNIGKFSQDQP